MLQDYLAAYTVEIYEFDHSGENVVYQDVPIAIGKIDVDQAMSEIAAAMSGENPSAVIDIIQEHKFNVTFTFIGTGDERHIGVFPRDEVRSFEIYTYIDGTTRNITTDNLGNILPDQNHLTEVATTLNLVFDVVVFE